MSAGLSVQVSVPKRGWILQEPTATISKSSILSPSALGPQAGDQSKQSTPQCISNGEERAQRPGRATNPVPPESERRRAWAQTNRTPQQRQAQPGAA